MIIAPDMFDPASEEQEKRASEAARQRPDIKGMQEPSSRLLDELLGGTLSSEQIQYENTRGSKSSNATPQDQETHAATDQICLKSLIRDCLNNWLEANPGSQPGLETCALTPLPEVSGNMEALTSFLTACLDWANSVGNSKPKLRFFLKRKARHVEIECRLTGQDNGAAEDGQNPDDVNSNVMADQLERKTRLLEAMDMFPRSWWQDGNTTEYIFTVLVPINAAIVPLSLARHEERLVVSRPATEKTVKSNPFPSLRA